MPVRSREHPSGVRFSRSAAPPPIPSREAFAGLPSAAFPPISAAMGKVGLWIACIMASGSLPGQEVAATPPRTGNLPDYESRISVSGSISLSGSGVMASFLRSAANHFQRIHPEVSVHLAFPSSAGVIERLFDGSCPLGATSRPLSGAERKSLERRHGAPVAECVVGRDGLLVIVHRTNPLPGISLDQLDGIYSDALLRGGTTLTRWGELGLGGHWEQVPIVPWGGAAGWGTTLCFAALACQGAPGKPAVQTANVETGIPMAVAQMQNAIGYTTLSADCSAVRILPVAEIAGAPFVPCTPATLGDGSYPLGRELYVYVVMDPGNPNLPACLAFVRFVLSRAGQDLAAGAGFVPIDATQARRSLSRLAIPSRVPSP